MEEFAWADVARLVDGCGLAHLSTASPAGDPHVAVVAPAREADLIWVAARTSSRKVANVRHNPKAALVWQGNGAETYLWGGALVVADLAEKSRLWSSGLFPFEMAGFFVSADSPDWALIRIIPDRVVAMVQTASGLRRRTWSPGPRAS
ncbi:MAG: pyridoxamine 5'-phosphate oxidase family protein [Ilumatobacteraceae bacterium]